MGSKTPAAEEPALAWLLNGERIQEAAVPMLGGSWISD
jgi:hypothetical protein